MGREHCDWRGRVLRSYFDIVMVREGGRFLSLGRQVAFWLWARLSLPAERVLIWTGVVRDDGSRLLVMPFILSWRTQPNTKEARRATKPTKQQRNMALRADVYSGSRDRRCMVRAHAGSAILFSQWASFVLCAEKSACRTRSLTERNGRVTCVTNVRSSPPCWIKWPLMADTPRRSRLCCPRNTAKWQSNKTCHRSHNPERHWNFSREQRVFWVDAAASCNILLHHATDSFPSRH